MRHSGAERWIKQIGRAATSVAEGLNGRAEESPAAER